MSTETRAFADRYGRAARTGKVTRRSSGVKRPNVRPLPLSLQVRPQPLAPTALHPDCLRSAPIGEGQIAADGLRESEFESGHGLSGHGGWEVLVAGRTYRHHDVAYALGWVRAAAMRGIHAEVYRR